MAIEPISQNGGGFGNQPPPTNVTAATIPNTGSISTQVSAGVGPPSNSFQFDPSASVKQPVAWEIPFNGKIQLSGEYPQNTIEIDRVDISKITAVEDTSFRFILVLRNNNLDPNPKLYTSERYYIDLEYAIAESNPYFTLQSFNRPFVVEVTTDEINQKVRDLRNDESKLGVEVYQSLMFKQNYISGSIDVTSEQIDHYPLIRYIDWLVSPRNGLDDTYNTVKPVWEIGKTNFDYLYADYDGIEPPTGSEQIDNTGGGATTNTPSFPPIGRAGSFIDEIVLSNNGIEFIWKIENGVGIWKPYDPDLNNQNGPGSGGQV